MKDERDKKNVKIDLVVNPGLKTPGNSLNTCYEGVTPYMTVGEAFRHALKRGR